MMMSETLFPARFKLGRRSEVPPICSPGRARCRTGMAAINLPTAA